MSDFDVALSESLVAGAFLTGATVMSQQQQRNGRVAASRQPQQRDEDQSGDEKATGGPPPPGAQYVSKSLAYEGLDLTNPPVCLFTSPCCSQFATLLNWLGLCPFLKAQYRWYRFFYHPLVCLLLAWGFIGWCIDLLMFIAGQRMPAIPGWFEQSTAADISAVGGVLLCGMSIISYIFVHQVIIGRHVELLSAYLEPGFTLEELMSILSSQAIKIVFFAVVGAAGGVAVLLSDPGFRTLYAQSHPAAAAFDVSITFLTFLVQMSSVGLAASVVAVISDEHRLEAVQFNTAVRSQLLSSEEAIRVHVSFKNRIISSCILTTRFFSVACVLPPLVLLFFLAGVAFNEGIPCSSLFRIYFILLFFVPVTYAWLSAANLHATVNTLYILLSESSSDDFAGSCAVTQMTHLYSYLSSWRLSGQVAFSLLGMAISYATLVRLFYMLALAVVAVLQKSLSDGSLRC